MHPSSYVGLAVGGTIVSLIYGFPIYLVVAAFAPGVTIIPDSVEELIVLGAIVAIGAIPFISRMAREDART